MIETLELSGALLLFGAASFRFLTGPSGSASRPGGVWQANSARAGRVMTAGLVLAIGTGIASRGDAPFAVVQLLLTLLFFTAQYLGVRSNRRPLLILAAIAALGVVGTLALSSHAASEAGFLPITSSIVHLFVAIAWGGAVVHLALQPDAQPTTTGGQVHEHLATTVRRYAALSLAALAVLALTGGLLGFVHVHNADALNNTSYGSAYKIKALLFIALLTTVCVQRARIVPACRNATSVESLRLVLVRFRRTVAIAALLLVALLVVTARLAAGAPPGVAAFLKPQTWQLADAAVPLNIALQPVAGRVSRARIEIAAADDAYRFPDGTIVTAFVSNRSPQAAGREMEMLPIGPAAFLGDVVFATPGERRLHLAFEYPDGRSIEIRHDFSLPGPPLEKDLRAYLSVATIAFSRTTVITFTVGMLLVLVGAWSIRVSAAQRAPAWLMPAGFVNGALGGFLVLSVMFVKTYPSSFWPNPQPFTFDVAQSGETIYREHCAECHGLTGSGDGPWALAGPGRLPDLAAPHMDTHTDGEVFWWSKYGIPSLDMPALGEQLDDDEIWTVINFLRSLRHDFPPQE